MIKLLIFRSLVSEKPGAFVKEQVALAMGNASKITTLGVASLTNGYGSG